MSQIRNAQSQKEIKCHADKFFHNWAHTPYLLSNMCPHRLTKLELHEGDWNNVGSIISWYYILNGEHEVMKTKTAEIDATKKSVTYDNLDGHILKKYYKYLKSNIQIIPKDDNHCIVKWSIDYEKMNEDAPGADIYVDFLLTCAKEIEALI